MQDSQWLRDSNWGVRQHRLPQCWITFWYKIKCQKCPFYSICLVDAKYAKHLRVFGEACAVVDTDKMWGGPRLIQEARSVYLLGTALNMQEKSTDS